MVPTHVAIIPDGNRRWARQRNLPVLEGHRQGAERTISLIEKAADMGVKYLTFWALSTENIKKRGADEVQNIFKIGKFFFNSRINEMHKRGARVHAIGNIDALPTDVRDAIYNAIEKTKSNTKIHIIYALNYGGRDEVIRAIHKILAEKKEVTKENFGSYLDTAEMPDPDLIIRTGGEQRLSGFMLWQCEYSEFVFLDEFFPGFTPELFETCINDFMERQRRFGK